MRLAFVIPTRDRPQELDRTLAALGTLTLGSVGARVLIADNASATPPAVGETLPNGIDVAVLQMGENLGAAARNLAAKDAEGSDWIVMLDDDSAPMDAGFVDALRTAPAEVWAVTADIHLSDGRGRESGGLPEVPVGCGVAYRTPRYLELGGYDPSFGFYAEEYDLAARILLGGGRVHFDPRFHVEHRKSATGRDMSLILGRLVRNNGWVMRRYAPDGELGTRFREVIERYRAIAQHEGAMDGFQTGARELGETVASQTRTPMPEDVWARFIGLDAARRALRAEMDRSPVGEARVIGRGKHDWVVDRALVELGIKTTDTAPTAVIGTMSPGPMMDAAASLGPGGGRVILPWTGAFRPAPSRLAI